MTSEKQRIANRMNAQKSTGPKTDEGKAVSSRNATTHGLSAASPIVLEEDATQFAEFAASFREEFRPTTAMQRLFVERIIFVSWRLQRVPAAEVAAYTESTRHMPRATAAYVLAKQAGLEGWLGRLQQYEQRLERSLHAMLRQFYFLKKMEDEASEQSSESSSESAETHSSADPVIAREESTPQNEANSPLSLQDAFTLATSFDRPAEMTRQNEPIQELHMLDWQRSKASRIVSESPPHRSKPECPSPHEGRCEPSRPA